MTNKPITDPAEIAKLSGYYLDVREFIYWLEPGRPPRLCGKQGTQIPLDVVARDARMA